MLPKRIGIDLIGRRLWTFALGYAEIEVFLSVLEFLSGCLPFVYFFLWWSWNAFFRPRIGCAVLMFRVCFANASTGVHQRNGTFLGQQMDHKLCVRFLFVYSQCRHARPSLLQPSHMALLIVSCGLLRGDFNYSCLERALEIRPVIARKTKKSND